MKKFLVVSMMLLAAVAVSAKGKNDWKGKVVDEKGEPLAYANVAVLSKADSTVVCGAVTEEDGTSRTQYAYYTDGVMTQRDTDETDGTGRTECTWTELFGEDGARTYLREVYYRDDEYSTPLLVKTTGEDRGETTRSCPDNRYIEVKGRAKGAKTVTLTRNELCYAVNQKDIFILALVLVDGNETEGPYYIRNFFDKEPDWAQDSINYNIKDLLSIAVKPEETLL